MILETISRTVNNLFLYYYIQQNFQSYQMIKFSKMPFFYLYLMKQFYYFLRALILFGSSINTYHTFHKIQVSDRVTAIKVCSELDSVLFTTSNSQLHTWKTNGVLHSFNLYYKNVPKQIECGEGDDFGQGYIYVLNFDGSVQIWMQARSIFTNKIQLESAFRLGRVDSKIYAVSGGYIAFYYPKQKQFELKHRKSEQQYNRQVLNSELIAIQRDMNGNLGILREAKDRDYLLIFEYFIYQPNKQLKSVISIEIKKEEFEKAIILFEHRNNIFGALLRVGHKQNFINLSYPYTNKNIIQLKQQEKNDPQCFQGFKDILKQNKQFCEQTSMHICSQSTQFFGMDKVVIVNNMEKEQSSITMILKSTSEIFLLLLFMFLILCCCGCLIYCIGFGCRGLNCRQNCNLVCEQLIWAFNQRNYQALQRSLEQ